MTVSAGIANAQTRSTTSGEPDARASCEVCLREEDFERCERDALAVDGMRRDLRACQRDLDASAGEVEGAARAFDRMLAEERARSERLSAELERARQRPSWRALAIVAACSLGAGLALGLILR